MSRAPRLSGMATTTPSGYLRMPSISGGTIVFVTEDDLWSVPAAGGPARRLTADMLGTGRPVLSPDALFVAFTSEAQGQPDVHVVPTLGGMPQRLTWLGNQPELFRALGGPTRVLSWAPDGRVVFASDAGQPFRSLTMAYAVPKEGDQPPEPLPYGPVRDVSYGPGGGVVIGRNTADPAIWKRYRGGTAGAIWIDREGNGEFEPLLRPEALGGNLASPMWLGERVYFLSDHEGIGNLYSSALSGSDVTRHTDHAGVLRPSCSERRRDDRLPDGGAAVALRPRDGPSCGSPGRARQPDAPNAGPASWRPTATWAATSSTGRASASCSTRGASCSASLPSIVQSSSTGPARERATALRASSGREPTSSR